MIKALIDDKVVELTPEQVEEFNKIPVSHFVTEKQRISALESAIADLAILLSQNLDNEENV